MRISKSMIKSVLAALVLLLSAMPEAGARTCFLPDSEDCGQGDGGVSDISDVGSCRYYTCKDAGYKNDNPYQECYVENTVNIKNNKVSCYAVRCKMSQTACEEKAEGTNKCCNRDVASGCYYVGTCPKDCDRSIYSYDSEQTGDGWTCISCHDGKGTFYKCNYDKTCEEQGYATSCSDEQIAEEVTSAKGQNGEKCYTCKGKPLSCPDGYSTTVKTCASGYKLETNGAIEGTACGKCVEEGCPSGYATSTTSCPSGYTLETNGKSGSKTCGKCVKDTPVNYCGDGYCIEFRFLCNGETCSNEVLKNISISVDDDWSLTNYTYYNSSVYDGQTVNIEVRIDEEADVYIENLEENIINVPDAGIEYNISDTEYREAIVYEELNKTISSASAFECEENETSETCLERYGAVADSCYQGNDSVCTQLETATKHITRTFNLYVPSGETRCIYYAATCPHLPQNGKLFQSDTSGTSGPVSQYYSWKEGSSSSSSSLDSVYGSSEIKGYNQYGQFASDCIKKAYIVTSNGGYELEQMSQDAITDAFNKAKGDEIEFFNPAKDTVILSNCKLRDTDKGTLYVYPNTDYQEFYKNGNTLFPSEQYIGSSQYDVENQTVEFKFYKSVNYCNNPNYNLDGPKMMTIPTAEDITPAVSTQYTSRGGYIFNTTGEGACISVGKDSQSVNIYGCHKTYPISWQTRMIQDKIYPYNEIHGKYESSVYQYTYEQNNASYSEEGNVQHYELWATRPLPEDENVVWKNLTGYGNGLDGYFCTSVYRSMISFNKGYKRSERWTPYFGGVNSSGACANPLTVCQVSNWYSGTEKQATKTVSELFYFGIKVVDDYLLISGGN